MNKIHVRDCSFFVKMLGKTQTAHCQWCTPGHPKFFYEKMNWKKSLLSGRILNKYEIRTHGIILARLHPLIILISLRFTAVIYRVYYERLIFLWSFRLKYLSLWHILNNVHPRLMPKCMQLLKYSDRYYGPILIKKKMEKLLISNLMKIHSAVLKFLCAGRRTETARLTCTFFYQLLIVNTFKRHIKDFFKFMWGPGT
jgi:hypothetical protein